MLKFAKDGTVDLVNTPLTDLRDYCVNNILTAFIENGGKGLRQEVFETLCWGIDWRKAQDIKQQNLNK